MHPIIIEEQFTAVPATNGCAGCNAYGDICLTLSAKYECEINRIIFVFKKESTEMSKSTVEKVADTTPYIPWIGTRRPVKKNVIIEYICRDGYEAACPAGGLSWIVDGHPGDIVRWRIHKEKGLTNAG